ncbi:hypothetical protein A6S26_21935 [Nostoc sp. ATCC 43529]|nr:hypothetical protein A6S26_21935 [Nostoc sp. ATCC 43529]
MYVWDQSKFTISATSDRVAGNKASLKQQYRIVGVIEPARDVTAGMDNAIGLSISDISTSLIQ